MAGITRRLPNIVHFESETEVAGPAQCTHQDITPGVRSPVGPVPLQRRDGVHGSTASQLRVNHFLAKLQLLTAHLRLLLPSHY